MAEINVLSLLRRKPSNRRNQVNTKTADYTILPKQTGETFVNTGASGAVTFTIPAGRRIGDHFQFRVNVAQELRIDPGLASDTIVCLGISPGAGKYITANAIGEHIDIEYIGGGEWMCSNIGGTWTAEA